MQLKSSFDIFILSDYFYHDLKCHSKEASKRLFFCDIFKFSSPNLLFAVYRGVLRPCMENALHIWDDSTQRTLLKKVESITLSLIKSQAFTDSLIELNHFRYK